MSVKLKVFLAVWQEDLSQTLLQKQATQSR